MRPAAAAWTIRAGRGERVVALQLIVVGVRPSCTSAGAGSCSARRAVAELVALVCASIVADYDRSWLARRVAQLIPPGGQRADRLSRLKAQVRGAALSSPP